jgi:ribonuclease HI
MNKGIIIYCDGGSRGNPGKSAAAFVIGENGKRIYSEAKYLGIATNNFAEYSAVLAALCWLKKNEGKLKGEIVFNLDSELVVRQINGEYKIKNKRLKGIYLEIKNIIESYPKKIIFKNISREKNKTADLLVNQKLDSLL